MLLHMCLSMSGCVSGVCVYLCVCVGGSPLHMTEQWVSSARSMACWRLLERVTYLILGCTLGALHMTTSVILTKPCEEDTVTPVK